MKSNNPDIFIVDEDDATCTVLEAFFKLKGYSTLCVSTGTKALDVLKYITPRIILLDILLPDIKGYDVCKEIKSNDKLVDIQVFYTSALPEINISEHIVDTKADGYFLKPFDFTEFNILFAYLG